MAGKRRSYEGGHTPKFMVVIDDSPECGRAVHFASRRAARTGAKVLMLHVIQPRDRHQQWLGVADIMREEAEAAANAVLDAFAARSLAIAGSPAERVIREGDPAEQIIKLIEHDEDIAFLVLAAGTQNEGPGPLVTSLIRSAGSFPIPVVIVPGAMSDDQIDALA